MRLGSVVNVNPEQVRKDYSFNEIKYIDISSVGTGVLNEVKQIEYIDAPSRAKRIVKNGDTILATVRPNLRAFWFAQNVKENTIASTGFAVLRANEGADPRFIYYTVTNQHFTDYLTANAKGAAYPAVDTDTIERADVYLPSFTLQQKIAAILSAYDDLIENNLRRIKILEEMAQNHYREWFVNFRFPGHEQTRFVDSPLGRIPEGWEIVNLEDIADQVRNSIKPETLKHDTPYVGLEHIPRRSITLTCWGHASEVQSIKYVFENRDILFGKIRPYFHKVIVAPLSGICSSDAIVIRAKSVNYFGMVLSCTASAEFVEHASATSQGTKMPRANWDVLTKYQIPLPPQTILDYFNNVINDIIKLLQALVFININLRQTRDFLLPKLISGELDVSDIEIEIPKEALA